MTESSLPAGSADAGGPSALHGCLAPAKLNLFLHITGRRADGYHTLQTVFQMVDWGDRLHFTRRDDGLITRLMPLPGVEEAFDLTVRAARLLQAHTGCRHGVDIAVDKILPMGAGLGGGSSDAATTLLALNRLWNLSLPRAALQALALRLGADVPFFVFGRNAFAEGVGEELQAVPTPAAHFLIVTPPAHVPTAEIFSAKDLTRDSKAITITDFLGAQKPAGSQRLFGRNDMQAVVAGKYAEVARVLRWFSGIAPARMSGSGASVFASFADRETALAAQATLPSTHWKSVVAASLETHPLYDMAQ
ncbi:MAG: 4-(cytidine 5'-diphospho)-2-C-methyl-D-erythritol kinase [Janthinobacterium lividum]